MKISSMDCGPQVVAPFIDIICVISVSGVKSGGNVLCTLGTQDNMWEHLVQTHGQGAQVLVRPEVCGAADYRG